MLARSFLSHADLEISAKEHAALIKVLGWLETGKLVDGDCACRGDYPKFGFDMAVTHDADDCGTIACIGGWAAIIMRRRPHRYVDSYIFSGNDALTELYWNYPLDVTAKEAAVALRNFLERGDPCWEERSLWSP